MFTSSPSFTTRKLRLNSLWSDQYQLESLMKGWKTLLYPEKQISCYSFKVCLVCVCRRASFKRRRKCEWRSLRRSVSDRQRQWTETHLLDEIAFTLCCPASARRWRANTQLTADCDSSDPKQCKLMRSDKKSDGKLPSCLHIRYYFHPKCLSTWTSVLF